MIHYYSAQRLATSSAINMNNKASNDLKKKCDTTLINLIIHVCSVMFLIQINWCFITHVDCRSSRIKSYFFRLLLLTVVTFELMHWIDVYFLLFSFCNYYCYLLFLRFAVWRVMSVASVEMWRTGLSTCACVVLICRLSLASPFTMDAVVWCSA